MMEIGTPLTAYSSVLALGCYIWEAPKREKQAHYQAWQKWLEPLQMTNDQ